jgi:hypothetical protein
MRFIILIYDYYRAWFVPKYVCFSVCCFNWYISSIVYFQLGYCCQLVFINFFTCLTAKEKKKLEDPPSDDDDVLIVYELTPTPEQKALATKLRLPPTFFCYKNRPDYVSEEEDGKSSVI